MPRAKTEKVPVKLDSYEEVLQELEKREFKRHEGQDRLHKAIFELDCKRIWAQCGRNFGKSVEDADAAATFACTRPRSHCYIVLPEKTQAKEIFWDSGLLLSMIPEKYIAKNKLNHDAVTKDDLRIRLTNGSFIKLMGADDPDSLRGIKPHFCIYDEYRDFRSAVYWNMEANLIGKNATLVVTSTPPDVAGHYSELRDYFLSEIKSGNDMYYYMELPTEVNPHIDKKMLADTKRRLIAHGQIRVWEREYMAKYIPGGASAVFPMFADRKEYIVKPSHIIDELVKNDREVLEFYALFDPASSSVFGVLLLAINKHTSQIFCLKELYERDRKKTSSIDMWKRTNGIKEPYLKRLDKWENFYDEHESWFMRDLERYDILNFENSTLSPTEKQSRDKQEDLATIKDLMLLDNRFFISDQCTNLIEEIESYATDKNGKIVKKKDHLLDCLRYGIAASDFTLNEQPNYEEYLSRKQENKQMNESFELFMRNKRKSEDWTSDIDESALLSDETVYLEDLRETELF